MEITIPVYNSKYATTSKYAATVILHDNQCRSRVIIIMGGYLYRIKVSVYVQVYIQVKTAINTSHVEGREKKQYISKTITQFGIKDMES